jgi:hypothetical protein
MVLVCAALANWDDPMKIFIWRHSKLYSSWSMFDEPHVYQDNYLQAEIIVLANSEAEAIALISREEKWNVEELQRLRPRVLPMDEAVVVGKFVQY